MAMGESAAKVREQTSTAAKVYRRRAFHWRHEPLSLQELLIGSGSLQIDADMPLMQAGVNSVMAIKLSAVLQAGISSPLSSILAFEHPTPRAIAEHLALSKVTSPLASVDGL
eukprot:1834516-Prymnesium_polylepis.1